MESEHRYPVDVTTQEKSLRQERCESIRNDTLSLSTRLNRTEANLRVKSKLRKPPTDTGLRKKNVFHLPVP